VIFIGLKTTETGFAMQVKIITKYENVFNQKYTIEDDFCDAQLEKTLDDELSTVFRFMRLF
jgi:hypothetical protein